MNVVHERLKLADVFYEDGADADGGVAAGLSRRRTGASAAGVEVVAPVGARAAVPALILAAIAVDCSR